MLTLRVILLAHGGMWELGRDKSARLSVLVSQISLFWGMHFYAFCVQFRIVSQLYVRNKHYLNFMHSCSPASCMTTTCRFCLGYL